MRIGRKYAPPLALLLVSMMGTAYAVSTLFTQTFPAILPQFATPNCVTLVSTLSSVGQGSSGGVVFACGSDIRNNPALTVTNTATVTPQFTLPTGYTALFIGYTGVIGAGSSGCTTSSVPLITLTSGTPVTPGANTYDYCANFSTAPSTGLATFDIKWTA
jgi:hypothetical protein